MASILDQKKQEEEQKLASLRTKGIHVTPGTGPAEMTYKPIEQRTAAEARALGISPKVQGQIAQEQGLIQPQAPIAQPARQAVQPMPQATQQSPYSYAQPPSVSQVNSQLGMARGQIGANAAQGVRRLTDMVAQVDPRIRDDANARREWRMMTPQQRKEHIGLKKLEMDARDAESAAAGATWEDIDKTSRSFADATGTAMDSYGNSFYTPDQQMFIREQRRNIDRAAGELFSNADRSSWQNPQDMYQAIASLPEVQAAGPFGQAYAFNIMRRFATPQMRAQMEAEDRNQKLFRQSFTAKAAEEIIQRMAQEGHVSPEYASGYRFTNEGSEEFADQIWLNREKDPRAGQIVNEIMAGAPVMWAEEGGRVVQDPAHQERRRSMLEQQGQQAELQAKKQERDDAIRAEKIRYSGIRDINPERASMMKWNEATGTYDDLSQYAPEKQETNWDEIYQNDARMAATESLMSWSRFTDEAQASEEAARQFPTNPSLPPADPANQQALAAQQQAVAVWRTQVNPPEKRAELEREIYNLKLRGQELRKGFQNPPQAQASASVPQSTENITLNSPAQAAAAPTGPQAQTAQPTTREVPIGSGKKQNRQNYEKAGTFRVGKLPDESIYEQYKATGRVSVASGDMDKIPIAVSVAGKNEYITMVDPNELSSFMKKQGVGAASPVKVRVVPIDDIAEVSVSDKDVDSIRKRYGISPFANKKQVLAVAADRVNNENKKRVHPFKNLLDWSPDLQWFQA